MDFAAKHNIITMDKRIDKSLCHSSFSIIRLVYTILCLFDKTDFGIIANAAFHYPVISLLVVAAIVLLVCLATPVITFMQNVKQSVVERLRQN